MAKDKSIKKNDYYLAMSVSLDNGQFWGSVDSRVFPSFDKLTENLDELVKKYKNPPEMLLRHVEEYKKSSDEEREKIKAFEYTLDGTTKEKWIFLRKLKDIEIKQTEASNE